MTETEWKRGNWANISGVFLKDQVAAYEAAAQKCGFTFEKIDAGGTYETLSGGVATVNEGSAHIRVGTQDPRDCRRFQEALRQGT